MLYRDDIGIKFLYSLLKTSEMKFFMGMWHLLTDDASKGLSHFSMVCGLNLKP